MASYTNRAPSPLSRPNNPNPRNSESNSGTRRSFSGNPISRPSIHTNPRSFCPSTPANSPSDFARRRSMGRDGPIAVKECEEKENDEKDHNSKAAKIRSPVMGSKNFMSPTISAASKFTPSPRKKVLAERNDPVRTSISLSDGKAIFFSANHEPAEPKSGMDMDQNKVVELAKVSDMVEKKAVTEGPLVSKPLKKVTFSEVPLPSENGQESTSNSVIIDSGGCDENMISCSSKPCTIAPLDADPSMPPYDPKTNYLSPRPQFLHYKPNTRIEILLNKENGLESDGFKKLEESFMSEIMSGNTSDSDGTEESSQKEVSEDASSDQLEQEVDGKEEVTMLGEDDLVLGIDEKELESEVTGSSPISAADTDAISEENFEAKRDKTSWISPRLKWVSLLLVFLIACASILITDSPVTRTSMPTDLSFSNLYHQSRAASFAKWNLDGFVRNVNQYSVNSLSYISKLITDIGRVDDRLGTLQFMNLTDLQKEIMIGDLVMNKEFSREFEENEMEKDLHTEFQELEEEEESSEANYDEAIGEEIEEVSDKLEENEAEGDLDTELQEFEEKVSPEFDLDQIVEKETEVVPPAPATLFTEVEPNSNQESIQNEVEIVPDIDEQKSDTISEDQLAMVVPLVQETQNGGVTIKVKPEIIETEKIEADIELDHKSLSETDSRNHGIWSAQVLESIFSRIACKSEAYIVEGSCAIIALLGAAAFFYWNQRTSPSSSPVTGIDPLLTKKAISGLVGGGSVVVQHVYKEKPQASHNWTGEDVVGVSSCPSEMSSFEKSWSSYSKKEQKVTSEAQSHERKARRFSKRESMASSVEYSSESPPYGSFTTYERIPIKHVNGEEEIITPVRRSSRLRSQVTSQ